MNLTLLHTFGRLSIPASQSTCRPCGENIDACSVTMYQEYIYNKLMLPGGEPYSRQDVGQRVSWDESALYTENPVQNIMTAGHDDDLSDL